MTLFDLLFVSMTLFETGDSFPSDTISVTVSYMVSDTSPIPPEGQEFWVKTRDPHGQKRQMDVPK